MLYNIKLDGQLHDVDAVSDDHAIRIAKQLAGQLIQEGGHQVAPSFDLSLCSNGEPLFRIAVNTQRLKRAFQDAVRDRCRLA